MFTATEPTRTPVSAPKTATPEEIKSDGPSQINYKYDWYQNVTHIFVAYKIKQGGEAFLNGGLIVHFTDSTMILENSKTGEILASIEFSNPIDPTGSTWTCTKKRIDIKMKKQVENENWTGLEKGSGTGATAIPVTAASGPISYPSSSKNKKNWDTLDKDLTKELSDDKPEGD